MTTTTKRKPVTAVVDAPYVLHATRVTAMRKQLTIALTNGVTIAIPIAALGAPWTSASPEQLAHVRLRMGGTWLWWDEIGEGLVLDELLATVLRLNPAAMLARRGRGYQATPAKAAAARVNGAKGGRPRRPRTTATH